ncbi:10648_t:CDS:2, partial [Entrophospora sp. SA101]
SIYLTTTIKQQLWKLIEKIPDGEELIVSKQGLKNNNNKKLVNVDNHILTEINQDDDKKLVDGSNSNLNQDIKTNTNTTTPEIMDEDNQLQEMEMKYKEQIKPLKIWMGLPYILTLDFFTYAFCAITDDNLATHHFFMFES